jgi:hydroxymethylbilane synthase
MLPAVAQGAICVECRADDRAVRALLDGINHAATMTAITAERDFLAVLDGSCRTPIAALAELDGDRLRLRGLVASPDGASVERIELAGDAADPATLGLQAGSELKARLPSGYLAQA